jgi:hypothetical protein
MPDMPLPLTDFQRLMLGWNEYQPFNVVDVVELRGPADAARLRIAAEAELAEAGVAYPTPDETGAFVAYPCRSLELEVRDVAPAAGAFALTALGDQISAEMNRPFRPGVDPLLRLWVLRTTPHPCVGMTWQHWPIDGMAAGDLFRRILARFRDLPLPAGTAITDRTPADLREAFAPWHTWRRKLFHLRIGLTQMLRARRNYLAPPSICRRMCCRGFRQWASATRRR